MANAEHVFPNSKFKWTEKLVKDLLTELISSETTTGFQGKDFNANKPQKYEEVLKELVRINKRHLEYFGPLNISGLLTYRASAKWFRWRQGWAYCNVT